MIGLNEELDQLSTLINFQDEQGKRAMLNNAREQGARLRRAKSLQPYGAWRAWCAMSLRLTIKQVQRYLRFVREVPVALANVDEELAIWKHICYGVRKDRYNDGY